MSPHTIAVTLTHAFLSQATCLLIIHLFSYHRFKMQSFSQQGVSLSAVSGSTACGKLGADQTGAGDKDATRLLSLLVLRHPPGSFWNREGVVCHLTCRWQHYHLHKFTVFHISITNLLSFVYLSFFTVVDFKIYLFMYRVSMFPDLYVSKVLFSFAILLCRSIRCC